MKAYTGFWASFLFILATGCGGGEEGTEYEWKCYTQEGFDTCRCYEVAKGDSPGLSDAATEVDECSGYELCMSYYDNLREQGRCDCGGADLEPDISEANRRDTKNVDSCPDAD